MLSANTRTRDSGPRLLDQPKDGQRVAIVLGREVSDGEGLRRPRHQLLDRSGRANEGRPEGEIVIVRVAVMVLVLPFFALPPAVGVVEADEIRPVSLHLGRELLSTSRQWRRLHCRSWRRRGGIGGGIRRALKGFGIEQIL